ncbi:hypothetical protein ElyMa_004279500 [Elysia marginata]|uniref:Uncharacterized protein n=1 Tax=Elysia marginata TaxID=1093978 RepID=A0AAV4GVE0_9GAST|nr:hypothetical protein ElyMa_004279500 [Elysia marginata]
MANSGGMLCNHGSNRRNLPYPDLTGLLGGLCQTQATICNTACGAVCNCIDTCGAQCGGQLAECRGDGSNPLSLITCGFTFTACNSMCNTQCSFTTVAGVVDTIAGGVAGGKRK